jgi:hypothetical protein
MRVKKTRAGVCAKDAPEKTPAQYRAERYTATKNTFMKDVLEHERLEPTPNTYLSNFAPTGSEEAFYDLVVHRVSRIWFENIRDKIERPIPIILDYLTDGHSS